MDIDKYISLCQQRQDVVLKPSALLHPDTYAPYKESMTAEAILSKDMPQNPTAQGEGLASSIPDTRKEPAESRNEALQVAIIGKSDATESPSKSKAPAHKDNENLLSSSRPVVLTVDGGSGAPSRDENTRARGQNKKRKVNLRAAHNAKKDQICLSFACYGHCDLMRGDGEAGEEHDCGFSHTVSTAYANNSDLPEVLRSCVFAESGRICPYGTNCVPGTWGEQKHIDEAGRNTVKVEGGSSRVVTWEDKERVQLEIAAHSSNSKDDIVRSVKSSGLNRRKQQKPRKGVDVFFLMDDTVTPGGISTEPSEVESDGTAYAAKTSKLKTLMKGKTILAPLTTLGNLPFRRLCIQQGVEVTMSEMILGSSICTLKSSDIGLMRRHTDEKIFGLQVAGGFVDQMETVARIIENANVSCDFVDINMGCPLDGLEKRCAGSGLLNHPKRISEIVSKMSSILSVPLTVKTRIGYKDHDCTTHGLIPGIYKSGASAITIHGRTARQRYHKEANWGYIKTCRETASQFGQSNNIAPLFIGNGDLFDPQQIVQLWEQSQVDSVMIGRGALIKPWIFEEIRRGQLWDISSCERFDIMKTFCKYGLEHWGSDKRGIELTRRFLLEHLSFFHRYVPVGLMEVLPQKLNHRPPAYMGRDELECLMSKGDVTSWITLSERLLGKCPEDFQFLPKHKSHAY